MSDYQPPMDPRPDLFLDSETWTGLLHAAWQQNGEAPDSLFWALETVRCLGASIEVDGGKARIRYGWIKLAEYEDIRDRWLKPRMTELRPLLEQPEKWNRQDGKADDVYASLGIG